ncbi:MAG: prepilin-type N-terminal cleavage/methylation domain-containing protein [Candidatus Absconditabacteria bacterium]
MATKLKRYLKSFTLIELIIVIAIIAVLGTTAFLLLTQWMSKSRDGKRIADLNTISKSFSIYQLENSNYPIPDGKLKPGKINESILAYVGEIGEGVISKLGNLTKIPLDPQSKKSYLYGITYDAKEYQFGTVMENERESSYIIKVYANEEYKTKVEGNYNGIISYNDNNTIKYANVPSLLYFSAEGELDSIPLDDNNNTCYLIDGGSNIPNDSSCNNSINKILETKTGLTNTGILIVDDINSLSEDEINLMGGYNLLSKEIGLNNGTDIVSKLPVDGVCGESNLQTFFQKPVGSLCEAGTNSEVVLSGNKYEWTCNGINNGGNDSCYANLLKVNGVEDGFEKIAAGTNLTCLIDTNEDLWCWGTNKFGVIKPITNSSDFIVSIPQKLSGVSNVKKVTLGSSHICILEGNGDVKCAGGNDFGQLGVGNNADSSLFIKVYSNVKYLDANSKRTCVVNNLNEMYCRGRTELGEFTTGPGDLSYNSPIKITLSPGTSIIKDLDVGVYSICYVDQIDELYCIGRSYTIPHSSNRTLFTKMVVPEAVKKVSIGRYNGSFISTSGKVYVYGKYEGNGNVGNGEQFLSNHIPQLLTGVSANKLILYYDTSCLTDHDNKLYCWGNNFNNEISSDNISNKLIYEESSMKDIVKYLGVGDGHVCVVNESDNFTCIGSNKFGQLGNGQVDNELVKSIPYNVDTISEIERKSMDYKQTAGLDDNGNLYTAGVNSYGQLGVGNNHNSKSFQKVAGNINFKLMDYNTYGNGCGVSNDNKLYCWGDNSLLQLGITGSLYSNIPLITEGVDNVKDITIAYRSMCIIKDDNSLRCRGSTSGLGIGAINHSYQFQQVLTANIKKVVGRRLSVCALDYTGEVYCWGTNTWLTAGSLDVGTVKTANKVAIDNVEEISMGDRQVCGLRNDGQVYCWGGGMSGELGNGQNQNSAIPVKVLGLSGKQVVQVVSGNQHNCALTSQGEVYCWGFGTYGQIGNGTFNNVSTATKVTGLANVKTIVASGNISCAEKIDGARYCWGDISGMGNGSR